MLDRVRNQQPQLPRGVVQLKGDPHGIDADETLLIPDGIDKVDHPRAAAEGEDMSELVLFRGVLLLMGGVRLAPAGGLALNDELRSPEDRSGCFGAVGDRQRRNQKPPIGKRPNRAAKYRAHSIQ